MTLGELIERLEAEPADKVCIGGFGPAAMWASGGDYVCFRYAGPTTVGEMLVHARGDRGATNARDVQGAEVLFLDSDTALPHDPTSILVEQMLGYFRPPDVDTLIDQLIAAGHLPTLAVAVDRAQHGGASADGYRDPRDVAFVEYVASAMAFLTEEDPIDFDRLGWWSTFRELAKAAKARRMEVQGG